jgi:hypothetical protein
MISQINLTSPHVLDQGIQKMTQYPTFTPYLIFLFPIFPLFQTFPFHGRGPNTHILHVGPQQPPANNPTQALATTVFQLTDTSNLEGIPSLCHKAIASIISK